MGSFAIALLSLALAAAPADSRIAQGLDHFYNLEYREALHAFRAARDAAPEDPDRQNYVAQTVLFSMMLRNGALESELVTGTNSFLRRPKMQPSAEEEKEFRGSVDRAIAITAGRLRSNPQDRQALYASGVAYALRGNFNFMVEHSWLNALRDLTTARKQHNRLTEIDPSLIDAKMLQGMHDYIVGSLPVSYKILGFLAGFAGDRASGIRTIQEVAARGDRNQIDANILLGVIYRREKRSREVLPIIQDLLKRYPRNYLFLLELAQMYSDMGDKDRALQVFDRVQSLKDSDAPGFVHLAQQRIEYARGNLLFWYDDIDQALEHLLRARAGLDKMDANAGVLTLMRVGQCYDLQGKREEAVAAYRQAVSYAPQSEAAKESKRYIGSPYRRSGAA